MNAAQSRTLIRTNAVLCEFFQDTLLVEARGARGSDKINKKTKKRLELLFTAGRMARMAACMHRRVVWPPSLYRPRKKSKPLRTSECNFLRKTVEIVAIVRKPTVSPRLHLRTSEHILYFFKENGRNRRNYEKTHRKPPFAPWRSS